MRGLSLVVKNNNNNESKIISSEDLSENDMHQAYMFYNFDTQDNYSAEYIEEV